MVSSRAVAVSASILAALAAAVPVPAARADGGATIALLGSAFVAGFKAGEFIHGPRAIALSQADADAWDTDPNGITINQYNAAAKWADLPHVGGWFSGNVLAKATANGSKGSEMITRSSGSTFENGIGKAEVEYSPKLANVAGASYWGNGRVIASALATHTPGPKSKRPGSDGPPDRDRTDANPGGGRALVPWAGEVELTIPQINLLVSGDTSLHTAGITANVYVFQAAEGTIVDPDAEHPLDSAVWTSQILNEQISLTLDTSGVSFDVAGTLLDESMFSGAGTTRTLNSAVTTMLSFTMMVPEDWEYLDLRFDLEVEQEMAGSLVPSPASALLAGAACPLLLRRRRHR